MRRCSTSAIARAAVLAALAASPAAAQEWRGSATPGLTLHFPSQSWDDADDTSWFEQWQTVAHEGNAVPWFADLLHSEFGWLRDDDTWLFHVERWSPYDYGENTLLDIDWRGLRVGGQAHRWRTGQLRVDPLGTGDTGADVRPALGSRYNDDTNPDDAFFIRRYGGGGEIRIRPEDFGVRSGPVTQLGFYGSQELRTGYQQQTFLLDSDEVRTGAADSRFRGRTGQLDQEVTTLGGRLVAVPFGLATSVFDVSWQRFREQTPTVTVADLGATDPNVVTTGTPSQRTLLFVPDTNRITGQMQLSRRIGEATVHGGTYVSKLSQTGSTTPLQRAADFDGNDVTTYSAQAAADVPINGWLSVDAFGKAALRDNGMPTDTALFAPDNGTQIAPFLKKLRDVRGGAELVAAPMAGARIAAGWRVLDVDRNLEFADTTSADGLPQRAITPAVSLVRGDGTLHGAYVRGHARLLKRTRVSGELGYEWSPTIAMPTDLERVTYAEGRVTQALRTPVPITLAAFGHWRKGSSDGYELESSFEDRSQDKDFEQRTADWGASATAMPGDATTVYVTFTQQWNRLRFPHVRSNVPRPNGAAFVRFYLDSRLGWQSDVRVLAIGGSHQLTRAVDVSVTGWLTWADGHYPRGGDTADALNQWNEFDVAYGALQTAVGLQATKQLRFGLAYGFERFHDGSQYDASDLDGRDHAVTLSATWDFAIPDR